MARTASPSELVLRLPDPRFSVDFADYAADAKAYATTKKYMQDLFPGQNKPLPSPKSTAAYTRSARAKPLRELQRRRLVNGGSASQAPDEKFDARSLECLIMLDESSVSGTDKPSASFEPTTISSASQRRNATTSKSSPTNPAKSRRACRSLLQLPQGILGHVLAYVFAEERAVSITPYQSRVVLQRRRNRHGPNAVDIRSVMMHPALLVCHPMRNLGLDILYRDNLFLIDLCDMSCTTSTSEKEAGKYWDCWTGSSPPQMVQTALTRASNLRFQLPVPGAETTQMRGATKRKKDSQEDRCIVLESLRRVTALITSIPMASQPERFRSASPAAPKALRRKLSFRSAKRHDSLEFVCRGDSPPSQAREPLTTLEVVLVKPTVTADVHSQILDMIATCSAIPVSGNLEYHLELEGLRKLWAKRQSGRWLGSEPDGGKLLHDLRALGQPRIKSEPTQNTNRSKEISAQPSARADVAHRQKTKHTQHPIGTMSDKHQQARQKDARAHNHRGVAKKIREMENRSKITLLKGNKQLPTVEELQQIAADIRRGVY